MKTIKVKRINITCKKQNLKLSVVMMSTVPSTPVTGLIQV